MATPNPFAQFGFVDEQEPAPANPFEQFGFADQQPLVPQPPAPAIENPFAASRRQAVPVVEEEEKPSFNVMRGIGERAAELGGNLLALGQRGAEQLQETFADLPTEITWGGPQGLSLMSPNEIKRLEEETGKTYTEMRLLGSAADAWREAELGYEQHRGWEEGKQVLFDPDASFMDKAGGVGDIVSWGFETGLVSLPDMAAVLTAMPAYLASRTNEIAEERAEADGRDTDDLEASDLAIGAGTALVVSILERFGAQRLLNIRNSGGSITEGIIKGAGVEGLTEAQQELAEYLGAQAGTERGISFLEGLERTLQGVVGGGAFGGPAGGLSAVVGKFQGAPAAAPQQAIDQTLDDSLAVEEEIAQTRTAVEKAGAAEVAAARQAIPTAMPEEQLGLPGIEPAPKPAPEPKPKKIEETAPAETAAVQETTPQPESQPMEEDVAEGERLGALAEQVSDQPALAGMQFIGAEGTPTPAPVLVQTIEQFNIPLQEYQAIKEESAGKPGRPPVATGDQLRASDAMWIYLEGQLDALTDAGYDTKPFIRTLRKASGTTAIKNWREKAKSRGDQPITGRLQGGDIVPLGGRSNASPKGGWGKAVDSFFTDTYTALNDMLQKGPVRAPTGGIQIPAQPAVAPAPVAPAVSAPEVAPAITPAPTPEPALAAPVTSEPVAEAAPELVSVPEKKASPPKEETREQRGQRLAAEQYALPDIKDIPYKSVEEARAAQAVEMQAVRDSDATDFSKTRQLREIESRFDRIADALTVAARNAALEEAQRPKPKKGMTDVEAAAQAEAAVQPAKSVSEIKVATKGKRKVSPEAVPKGEALKTKAAERKKGKLGLKKPATKPTDNFSSDAARKRAASAGIPESEIEGTGRGGKIVVGDVERARVRRQIQQGEEELKTALAPAAPGYTSDQLLEMAYRESDYAQNTGMTYDEWLGSIGGRESAEARTFVTLMRDRLAEETPEARRLEDTTRVDRPGAGSILQAARSVPDSQKFGQKAFISAVWRKLDSGESLEDFKARLVDLHRKGELRLTRADLGPTTHPELTKESETEYLTQTWHQIDTVAQPRRLEDTTNAQEVESAAVSQFRLDLREDIVEARNNAADAMDIGLVEDTANSGDLLRAIQANLDPEDPYSILADRLARTAATNIEVDIPGGLAERIILEGADGLYDSYMDENGNRVRRITLRRDIVGNRYGLKVFMHEMVHAATAEGMTVNNELARKMERLRRHTINHLRKTGVYDTLNERQKYGLTNVDEFVAEALSSPHFQRVLAGVPAENNKNLWHKFVDAIAEFLDIDPSNSALSEVLSLAPDLFMTEEQVAGAQAGSRRFITDVMRERENKIASPAESEMEGWMRGDYTPRELMDRSRTVNTSKRLGNTLTGNIAGKMYDATSGRLDLREAARSGAEIGFGVTTLDQLIRRFKDRFQDGVNNALLAYQTVVRKKRQYAREMQQLAERINEQWRQFDKRGKKYAEILGKFMHDATMSDVHPDLPFNHPMNAHLAKRKGAKELHRQMQKRFNKLPAGGRGIYRAAAKYFRKQFEDKRRATLMHIARSWDLEQVLSTPVFNQLSIVKEPAEIDLIDFSALGEQEDRVKDSLKSVLNLTKVKGPYFPLRRFGKYVVEGVKPPERIGKSYAKRDQAWAAARVARANQPFAKIRTRKAKDGTYYNERVFRTVEMFDSITEADRRADELRAQGYRSREGGDIGSTLKEDWQAPPGSNAGALLAQAKRKVEGNKTLESTLDTAFLELLLENSMRKSELSRQKVAGASYDMRRAFAERAFAGSWAIADIQTALDHNNALRDMEKYHRKVKDVRLGEVVRELRRRDEKSLGDRRISKAESVVAQFGFVNFLFSPSYSMVNLTQVPLVAAPYLVARYGPRAMIELGKAYRGVAAAGASELNRVKFGAKGPPVNALDAMMNQLNPDERLAVQTLTDQGIIDATFMQELYRTSEGAGDNAVWNKIMDLARTTPQVGEVLNRIVVTRATYNLEKRKSKNHDKAVEAASEAVLRTQFDYTDQNKPPFFKAFPGMRAIMMFKMYAQGMWALIAGSAYHSFKGNTKEKRSQARKTLAGLIASHTLVGGVLGGVFMEPVRILISAWNLFAEDDDDPRDLDDDITQLLYRATGSAVATEVIARGLPRAVNIDLFSRVGLNTLAFMGGRDARSYQEGYREMLVAAGGPIVGVGDNIARGIEYLSRGETRRGIEAISPKLIRDALKTWRIADEGLLDFNGRIIAGKQDFNTSDYILQTLGFSPASVQRTYEGRRAQTGRDTKLRDRRKKLMMQWRRKNPKERAMFYRSTILPFNRKNPEYVILPANLLRSLSEQSRRESQTRAGAFTEKASIRRLGEAYGG